MAEAVRGGGLVTILTLPNKGGSFSHKAA